MEGQLVGQPDQEMAMVEDLAVVKEDELKEEQQTGLLAQVKEGGQI